MEQIVDVQVQPRSQSGKGPARKLRAAGQIPGVMYGHKERAQPFAVDPTDLDRKIRSSGFGRNTVLRVHGLERNVLALLKATQIDPVKRNLMHIDLIEVREDEPVVVRIPVTLTGKCKGVVAGGMLQTIRHELKLACTPVSIPREILVDVTELDMNETLHINELDLPAGVTNVGGQNWAIVAVHAPSAAEVAAEEEAAAAEAAEAAAPAAAAAEDAAKE